MGARLKISHPDRRLAVLALALGGHALSGQTIVVAVSNIPPSATRIVAVTDGAGITGTVYAGQNFAAGTAGLNMTIGVPAGGPYRVRAIAFVGGETTFPAILRSGKATGIYVAADTGVNASIALADIQATLDASTPTSGVAGGTALIKVDINDTGDIYSGTTLARIWSSATVFTQNLTTTQSDGILTSEGGGAYQASVSVALPASGGTLFYQFGEAPYGFSNPNGQEAPFFVWPNLESGSQLLEIAVSLANFVNLSLSNIPPSATRIVAVTDGAGITGTVYAGQNFAAGTAGLNMTIGVPAGGPYRVRAIAFVGGETTFPAILRSGKATGIYVAADTGVNASIALADIQATLDASTPTSGVAGGTALIKVDINDTGDIYSGTTLARIWSSATVFTQNLTTTQSDGILTSEGGGAYQASVSVALPASGGTLFYQFGEAPYGFSNPNGQEAPFFVWPNLESGSQLLEIAVSLANFVNLSLSNIPPSATRIVAVTDGAGITGTVYAGQNFAAGTAGLNMTIGVPAGGPYRVRAIAFVGGETTFPAILRSGKATGIYVAADTGVNASIALADIQATLDASTPTSGVAGGTALIKVDINDTGDIYSGTTLARIWSSATVFTQNLTTTQSDGILTSEGGGAYQASVSVALPASGGTLFYQFGEVPYGFSNPNGQEAPFFVWPNLENGGQLLEISVNLSNQPGSGTSRTFVSTTGNDGNTSVGCSAAANCRTFTAALSVTNPGGEIVVLNSGGYGPVAISQPVVITADDVVASISVTTSGNDGLIINTVGNVTLVGLSLHGEAVGNDGLLVEQVGFLRLYNTLIENFIFDGIDFASNGNLSVNNSTINDSGYDGILLQNASAVASVDNTSFDNNKNAGVEVVAGQAAVADSSAHYNLNAFVADGGTLVLFNDRAAFNGTALASSNGGSLYFAGCLIANNTTAYNVGTGSTMSGSSPGTSLITPAQATAGALTSSIPSR